MRQGLALAIGSWTLCGCSWLYNPNNLPSAPVIDAPSDAEVILDADPRMLVIDGVAPSMIYEGQGDFGSAPALVVIHGHHIVDNNTTVDLVPTSGGPALSHTAPVIARNGNWIAIPVTVPVDIGLPKAAPIGIDITVTETIPAELGGGTATSTLHGELALQGLDELTSASSIDTTTIQPLYSKVDLPVAITFTGASRAIIHAVSSITAKAITANGGDGGTAAATMMTAGGCAGGGPASPGGCNGTIGGKGAGSSTLGSAGGGGGGGFAADGNTGGQPSAGGGGSQNGDELIAVYDQNRAGGGGGGGNPTLGTGGGGGGGGGSIELTAGSDIRLDAVSANGGNGEKAPAGGGGGGGAGGLIMLRAAGSLTVSGSLSVNGGGVGKGTGGNGDGGAGAAGRVRWDAQTGGVPAVASGTLHRGPAFTVTTRVFREQPVADISLVGTPNDILGVYAVSGGKTYLGTRTEAGPEVTIGPGGSVTFHQLLEQGLSQLCVTVAGGKLGTSEADKCIDVAFLP
jgi:hypothetical protein